MVSLKFGQKSFRCEANCELGLAKNGGCSLQFTFIEHTASIVFGGFF